MSPLRLRDAAGTTVVKNFLLFCKKFYEKYVQKGNDERIRKMKMSDGAEEILETLWVEEIEKKSHGTSLGLAKNGAAVQEIIDNGYIRLSGEKVRLTEKGLAEGRKIVRRHRLSERLFTDVLDLKKNQVHPISCQFEHLIQETVEENICSLLGHPKTCPHGRAIPEGQCCLKAQKADRDVIALDNLHSKDRGKVAYINAGDNVKLKKLMAMGVLPGTPIEIIQSYPSYVFQIGQSQFAVDKELARCIIVRISK